MAKINKGIQAFIGDQVDMAPISTIAAIGSSQRYRAFPSETETAISPLAGLYMYCRFVNKLHDVS